ncbi:uncharacterized protein EDB91DRAFT_1167635 [Suillus paluster]|uniref:uncharacterized protein n=1 Tax=Suillus paluster TaxID=48578 RepID=UPI001B868A46|nr:uncharacterized protein EDB91DRAFT_1167635 [Suillus paluster]KAG1725710.1 hypothetical protein EDB91DRAFT_1167635 [Suillus paluster]
MSLEPAPNHSVSHLSKYDEVPHELQRAMLRLNFPSLYVPAWNKCRNGARRGLICGFAWMCTSYKIQRRIINTILTNPSSIFSVRYITRFTETADELSHETLLGFKLPFSISTYVVILLVGSQVTAIISFFVARNIRIARQRAWDQTVASRGKGPDFWQPYVEEWDFPPIVNERLGRLDRMFKMWFWRMIIKKVILLPLSLYPFVGTFIAAAFKGVSTAQDLHKPYFAAKKMTHHQEAVFIEERKWDYRMFGFVAALLEGLPIIGLVFTVSNRIGAAMWAHDLEKRQHYVAAQRRCDGHMSVVGHSNAYEAVHM